MNDSEVAIEVTEVSADELRKPKATSETRNVVYYTVASIVGNLLTAVASIFLARYLGTADYGRFSTGTSFLAIFAVFSGIGISQVMVRDVARNPGLLIRRSNQSFTLILFTSGILQGIAVIAASLAGYDSSTFGFILVYGFSSVLLNALINRFYLSFFQVQGTLSTFSIIQVSTQILGVILLFMAIIFHMKLIDFGIISVFSALVSIVFFYINTRKVCSPRIDFSGFVALMKESFPFGSSNILTAFYMQLGVVILSFLSTPHEVGVFSVPYKIVILTYLLPSSLYMAILPKAFRLGSMDHEEFNRYSRKFFRVLFCVGLPLSIFMATFPHELIGGIFGNQYSESAELMRIVSWMIVLKFSSFPAALILTGADRQAARTTIQAIIASLFVALCLVMIPRYGVLGMAVSTLLSDTLLAFLYVLFAFRYDFSFISFNDLWIPATFTMVLLAATFGLSKIMSIWIILPIVAICYLALILKSRYLEEIGDRVVLKLMGLKLKSVRTTKG